MAYNPDFTGRLPKDTFASLINTDGNITSQLGANIYNSTGSQITKLNIVAASSSRVDGGGHLIEPTLDYSQTSIFSSANGFTIHDYSGDNDILKTNFDQLSLYATNMPNLSANTLLGLDNGNNIVSISTASILPISSSYALTASYTFITQITQSVGNVISASWASASYTSSFLTPGTYNITASRAISASWAQNGVRTGSTYPITSSWTNNVTVGSTSVNNPYYITFVSGANNPILYDAGLNLTYNPLSDILNVPNIISPNVTGSLQGTSSWAISSSLAINALSSNTTLAIPLFLPGNTNNVNLIAHIDADGTIYKTGLTTDQYGNLTGSTFLGTASFARSASYASQSLSSSYAITASWAPSNAVQNTLFGSLTQSVINVGLKELVPVTGAFVSGSTNNINSQVSFPQGIAIQNTQNIFPKMSMIGLPFPNAAPPNVDYGSLYQFRTPPNFSNGGLTHSFQYTNGGTGNPTPTAGTNSFWELSLFALPNSNNISSNVYENPVLVYFRAITQSFAENTKDTGSVFTVTSLMTDPNNYLSQDSIISIDLRRVNSDATSTNYTETLMLLTYRLIYNVK